VYNYNGNPAAAGPHYRVGAFDADGRPRPKPESAGLLRIL
jgi:hypothetical protein